jgi:hypothetical protein
MLELAASSSIFSGNSKSWDTMTDDERRRAQMYIGIILVVYILIWIFALFRAVRCGKGQTKVMHVFFASVSPVLYLGFSFFSKDFCS